MRRSMASKQEEQTFSHQMLKAQLALPINQFKAANLDRNKKIVQWRTKKKLYTNEYVGEKRSYVSTSNFSATVVYICCINIRINAISKDIPAKV